MTHFQKIALKYHFQTIHPLQILGQIQAAVFFQSGGVAPLQQFRHKMRAEILASGSDGNFDQTAKQSDIAVPKAGTVADEFLNDLLSLFVNRGRNFQFIQCAGEGCASGLVVSGDVFNDKALDHETVKGVQILLQSDGGVSIGKTSPIPHSFCVQPGKLR